ncbi:MerR family transcriptional regulator [Maricaulis sp.]|uniref:MerR family transcriptional regulator n=1 Tax=Maricaulis sp. TaxID=1486257 RepID=UPI002634B034|nr:MerR family transcriptional regulator [Maricaulis sp.]
MSVTEKSPDAFRTISEAADELGVPAHVLRFWESKFAQISPLKRAGGRRFYRPQDIALLRGVKRLLYEDGYTIKGAKKFIKDNGVSVIVDLGASDRSRPEMAIDRADIERPVERRKTMRQPGSPAREIGDILNDLEGAQAKLKAALEPKS